MVYYVRQTIIYLPLVIGGAGLVFFGIHPFVNGYMWGERLTQIAGLVISILLVLAGLRAIVPESKRRLYYLLLSVVYLAGILAMGFRPKPGNYMAEGERSVFLGVSDLFAYDVVMNVIGFIPLGFLLIVAVLERHLPLKPTLVFPFCVLFCFCVSFIIESFQVYAVGRSSSLVDLATNTIGAVVGCGYGLLYKKMWIVDQHSVK